jgi:ABC transporter
MIGQLYHLARRDAKRRAEELLNQFDLTDAADRIAKTYSGGMRRRLDLAASLVLLPPVLFLDEPTTGLDPRSRRRWLLKGWRTGNPGTRSWRWAATWPRGTTCVLRFPRTTWHAGSASPALSVLERCPSLSAV